jgi:hypothetical protein
MQIKQTFNVIQPAKGKNNEFIAFESIVFYLPIANTKTDKYQFIAKQTY